MPLLAARSISFSYEPATPVLEGVSLEVREKETWAIIGRNGCGKSTLLKCLGGLLKVKSGSVELDHKPIGQVSPKESARRIAYVPQAGNRTLPPLTAYEFVMLGRFPYQGYFALPSQEDKRIIKSTMELTDTHRLAGRLLPTLSGGELQRIFLASAVAQRTDILLLDEPMAFLDPQHQEMIQHSVDRIHDEFGTAMIAVTHDVNHALNRFSHICAIVAGQVFFCGPAADFRHNGVKLLGDIYGIRYDEIAKSDKSARYYIPESMAS